MFSWATNQLEQLAQTVAPPPTDTPGKIVYCCQRGDEDGALELLNYMEPVETTIVHPAKGQVTLHVACEYSLTKVIRAIMSKKEGVMEVRDVMGNTPLHCACMSNRPNALDVVKMLISEGKASVVARNSQGQTPYDLSASNVMRQYLLPLQLQEETRQAIDNGGVGLPPGTDLGGMKLNNVAPPPKNVGPPMPMPPPASTGPHEYARTGSSSAAIYQGDSNQRMVRPDGFHSSSSDKGLQQKYGHAPMGYPGASVPPPPPSSGGALPAAALTGSTAMGASSSTHSAPPSLGGSNPFAAGRSGVGGAGPAARPANRRYVAFDAVTGQTVAPPPPAASVQNRVGAYDFAPSGMSSTATPPTFATFAPASTQQQQQQPSRITSPGAATSSATPGPVADFPPPPFQLRQEQQQHQAPAKTKSPIAFGSQLSTGTTAANLFSTPSPGIAGHGAAEAATASSNGLPTAAPANAADLFSRPAGISSPPGAGVANGGSNSISSNKSASELVAQPRSATTGEDEGDMDEVPLSPNAQPKQHKQPQQQPQEGASLVAAIGMPPPPYSRK